MSAEVAGETNLVKETSPTCRADVSRSCVFVSSSTVPREISFTTKFKVYHTVVLATLLYGFETWTVYRRHGKSTTLISGVFAACSKSANMTKLQTRSC